MKRFALLTALVLAPLQGAATPADGRLDPRTLRAVEGGEERVRVIVHLDAEPSAELPMPPRGVEIPAARTSEVRRVLRQAIDELEAALEPSELTVTGRFPLTPAFAVEVDRVGLARLLQREDVRFIEHDAVWRLHTAEGLALIGAPTAHAGGLRGEGTAVAIVDTGVDLDHPTLSGKVVFARDTGDEDDDASDCDGHGTAVASIAAGRAYSWSGSEVFAGGVAPEASVLAYKASRSSDCGSFYTSDVVQAIQDAVLRRDEHNVVAVNLSIGSTDDHFPGYCDSRNSSYAAAINAAVTAGVAVVVSAGNEAAKTGLSSPACVSGAISVGSVYDTTRSTTISYCGDNPGGECAPYLCTEQIARDTVTCYSNSSPFLDLLAPAELATAAQSGGRLDDIGGTSAAAPYVTGAIALLAQAYPDLTPAGARAALAMTGVGITDSRNGIVTPRIDLRAALAAGAVAAGDAVQAPIPDSTGIALASFATVDAVGFVAAVRVAVEVLHPDPSELRIDLVSPEGVRVTLHDHTAGSTGTNGMSALYPDRTSPAQPLANLNGVRAQGVWRLEVLDDRTKLSSGKLVSWSLELELADTPPPPVGSTLVLAVGAHAPGELGTFWVTDLRLFNRSPGESARVQLYHVPRDRDGRAEYLLTSVEIPANAVVDLPDVLATRFSVSDGTGSLLARIEGGTVTATSRTFNTGSPRGTFGQFIGGAATAAAAASGDPPRVLLQLANGSQYRTNVGFTEVSGEPATVAVTLYDGATGAVLGGPETFEVQPFSNTQVALFQELAAGESENAFALVEIAEGSGRVLTYASVIDAHTGDAIYVPGGVPAIAGSFMVPVVAKVAGVNGTNWLSDVRVYNPGPDPLGLELQYRPSETFGGGVMSRTVLLEPGRVLALDDILGQLFALTRSVGSLRIAVSGGPAPLLVTSRTYNLAQDGTYGQFIPAVTTGFGAGAGAAVVHLDATDAFRTNVGVCEVAGSPVQVRYALKDADGVTLGVGTVSLGPFEMVQIDGVAAALQVPEGANLRVDFFHDGGEGRFVAYGSVVDNTPTGGDAIFIPAAGL